MLLAQTNRHCQISPVNTVCRLCLKPTKLCNSHIIPEFCYGLLYDPKHRYHSMTDVDAGKVEFEQKGIRERLLCPDCEQKLSIWENYASKFFKTTLPQPLNDELKSIRVQGVDYRRFKLFLLSVLWRASVSSHPFFEHVELGPHEERIRAMLANEDPGRPEDYGCVIFSLQFRGKNLRDFFVEPMPARVDNHKCYRFVFAGFVFVYFVSSHAMRLGMRACFLQLKGSLVVLQSELWDFAYLRELWERFRSSRAPTN